MRPRPGSPPDLAVDLCGSGNTFHVLSSFLYAFLPIPKLSNQQSLSLTTSRIHVSRLRRRRLRMCSLNRHMLHLPPVRPRLIRSRLATLFASGRKKAQAVGTDCRSLASLETIPTLRMKVHVMVTISSPSTLLLRP